VARYFFHILDGQKVFADQSGKIFVTSEEAIEQAKCLAAELRKAGEFARLNRIVVTDDDGQRIFECRP
jgi:nicotinamidase-related amidase